MGLRGVMKSIVPVVMDGVLGIYGVIIDVIISAGIGYAHLSSGLACILAGLSAGMAIRIDGDAGVRMQEMSKEIPAGSLPRSLDVILHHDIVEQHRAGDTVIFTGTVVVIPDILALAAPGERADCHRVGLVQMRFGAALPA
ncbi:hypothetical protein SSX86_024594 [Deinandra increscens subsp. villosa]